MGAHEVRGVGQGSLPAQVRETHSAVVLLMGDRAYKMKKPVDLGFLDFSTPALRRAACHRELVLNRRMAPDVYLGVAKVLDVDGNPCEDVLVMRRMPDDRRLAKLVGDGVDVSGDVRHLARVVAAFHSTARRGPEIDECGGPSALRARWTDNLEAIRALRPRRVSTADVDRIEALSSGFVQGCASLLEARIRAGLIRDGHGDLLADDIFCLDDGPRVLDCLDFDDRLRFMDVLDDVACLAMDLERLGAAAPALQLVHDYAEFSGTPHPASLHHHYVAYRAVMRAKVAALREAAGGSQSDDAAREAALLCRIGLNHLEAARRRLVLVGGPPGSGKTSVASGLGDRLGAVVLGSDRTRKELLGRAPTSHAPAAYRQGIYDRDTTLRTYQVLADRASTLLGMGETVVVDASFTTAQSRAPFRAAAAAAHADLSELRCTVPAPLAAQRVEARTLRPDRYSDADLAVALRLAREAEPWPQAQDLDTSGPLGTTIVAAATLCTEVECR
jgi:uncharacterized protein